MDYFASVTLLAEFLAGTDLRAVGRSEFLDTILPAAVGRPGSLTAKGKQMQSVLVHLTGGRRPFDTEGIALSPSLQASVGVLDLNNDAPAFSPGVSPLYRASGNAATDYQIDPGLGLTAAALNAGVRRKAADAALRAATSPYVDLRPVTGAIARPLLSLHTTGDYTVPITVARAHRRAVERAGRGSLLVQRAIRNAGHCTMSVPEQSRAIDDLIRWAETGVRPDGDDLLADLSDIGRTFTDPLRPGDPGQAPDPAPPPRR
jgi:hypothetical protein